MGCFLWVVNSDNVESKLMADMHICQEETESCSKFVDVRKIGTSMTMVRWKIILTSNVKASEEQHIKRCS